MKVLESLQNGFSSINKTIEKNPKNVAVTAAFAALAAFFTAVAAIIIAPVATVILPTLAVGVPIAVGLFSLAINRWEKAEAQHDRQSPGNGIDHSNNRFL